MTFVPAGWYKNPTTGRKQWWDGAAWGAEAPSNPIGLASLIVGIAALGIAFVPVLSFVAWVPAITAIGLSIGGLIPAGKPKATAGIGLTAAVMAIMVGIIVSAYSIAVTIVR